MKKFIFVFIFFSIMPIYANYYTGFGAYYHQIQPPNNEMNENFFSLNLQLENRSKCKLWYGLGVNLAQIDRNEDAPANSPFFSNLVQLEPSIRYNLISNNTINYKFVPYLKTSLLFGYLEAEDNLSNISVGGTFSIGLSYGFNLFSQCFMIDLNTGYSGFNTLKRAEDRIFLESFMVGLNLSMKI